MVFNHGLVDRYFHEFGHLWILKNFGSQYLFENQCPYDGQEFAVNEELVDHLTFQHYHHLIMPELENRLICKNIKQAGERKMEMKCPFCNKRIVKEGWMAEQSSLDMKEMIAHCGSEHGFTMYHLISDKSIIDPYSLSSNIKAEIKNEDTESLVIEQVQTEPEDKWK